MENRAYRPRLQIPLSSTDVAVEIMAVAGLVLQVIMVAHFWPLLPDKIATHFGVRGEPNEWASKAVIWLLPGATVLLYGLFTILDRFPHIFNYPVRITPENAERQYGIALSMMRWLKMEMVWVFLVINYQSILVSLGRIRGLDYSIPLVLIIVVTVVIFLVRAYRAK